MIIPPPMTGPKLIAWRMQRGYTVDHACSLLGVGRTTWWRWERDEIVHRRLLALAIRGLN